MPSNDIRIVGWDLPASAGKTYELEFTSNEALTSLSLWVGGTLDDVDDLTGATEYAAVLSGANLIATVQLDVPSGTSAQVLRLAVNGAVITVGYLRPSAGGVKPSSPTSFSISPSTYSFTLNVNGIVVSGGPGADDQTAAEVPFTPTGGLAATDVQAALVELDSEKSATGHNHDGTYAAAGHDHAGVYDPAGTASSTVAAHEADTTNVHGIADTSVLETTTGAQAKADAAQAAAVQRANHTGTQLSTTISDLTEAIQDVVGAMATDSSTVNFTYDDVGGTLTAVVQGLTSASISDFAEAVDDRVAALLVAGTNVTLTYNDVANTLTIDVPTPAGTNLGYTASTRVLTSDTGTDVTLPLATGTDPGLMASADKTKLDGLDSGAYLVAGDDAALLGSGAAADAYVLTSDGVGGAAWEAATGSSQVAEGRPKTGATIAYSLPGVDVASRGGATLAVNRLYYEPRVVTADITIDQLAVEVTTAAGAAGAVCHLAVYEADTDWQPTTLVVDGGSVLVDSIGVKTVAVSASLPAGRYLFARHSDGNPQLRCGFGGQRYSGFVSTLGTNTLVAALYKSSVATGAFPSTGTAWDTMAGDSALMSHAVFCRVTSITESAGGGGASTPANYETLSTVAASGTTQTLDVGTATVFDVTLTANCTFTFSGASAGEAYSISLVLRQDATGGRTATWPASVDWPGGAAPTLTSSASAVDVLSFLTVDGGTTWIGFVSGQAML